VLSCAAPAADSLLDNYSLEHSSHTQWALPARLQEISALAMTADQRLLAVDDERAVIYEIDYAEGGLIKAFALGDPVLQGDFEGLAVAAGRIYLMSSDGDIYVAPEGADGERVEYERFKSKVDDECEFEGLATDKRSNRLLLLCKDLRKKADIDTLAIYPWPLDTQEVDQSARIDLPIPEISAALRTRRLHPSGIVVDPRTGHLLVVAAREHGLIELTADGDFVAARRLPLAARHPQAEGIELTADGRIVIADEAGYGRARLSIYGADKTAAAERR
jgi:uncharacterized protein YjiK